MTYRAQLEAQRARLDSLTEELEELRPQAREAAELRVRVRVAEAELTRARADAEVRADEDAPLRAEEPTSSRVGRAAGVAGLVLTVCGLVACFGGGLYAFGSVGPDVAPHLRAEMLSTGIGVIVAGSLMVPMRVVALVVWLVTRRPGAR